MSKKMSREAIHGYILFLSLTGVVAICLLWLVQIRTKSFELGYQIADLEKQERCLHDEIAQLSAQWTKLSSRKNLIQLNQTLGLQLLPPEDWWKEIESD